MTLLQASVAKRSLWRRVRHDDRGIVASVIIVPVVVLALWLVLQAAFVMHARNVAQAAAQDAAIAAATGSGDAGGVGSSLFNQSIGGFANLSGVDVSNGDDTVTVTVRAQVIQVTPFSFSVAETATAPIEEFIPQSSRN